MAELDSFPNQDPQDSDEVVAAHDSNGDGTLDDTVNWTWATIRNSLVPRRNVYNIGTGGGGKIEKLGEFRSRDARFRIIVIGALDQGNNKERQVVVTGYLRGGDVDAEFREVGSTAPQEVNVVLTSTTNDANGDGYDDAYLYIETDDFSDAKVILEYEAGTFVQDKKTVSSVTGTRAVDTSNAPTQQMRLGQIHTQGRIRTDFSDPTVFSAREVKSGTSAPSDSEGKNGDIYIQTN